jgi:hypothetical protein
MRKPEKAQGRDCRERPGALRADIVLAVEAYLASPRHAATADVEPRADDNLVTVVVVVVAAAAVVAVVVVVENCSARGQALMSCHTPPARCQDIYKAYKACNILYS